MAVTTACVRSDARSFVMMHVRWFFTVRSRMIRWSPMILFEQPSATSDSTCSSLSVKGSASTLSRTGASRGRTTMATLM